MVWRLILGTLSTVFGLYALRELVQADSLSVGIIAALMLVMALAGLTEAFRKHPRL